jgi:hypothetical protein
VDALAEVKSEPPLGGELAICYGPCGLQVPKSYGLKIKYGLFSFPFIEFTNQRSYKYRGIRMDNAVAGDLGPPDLADGFAQLAPGCHSSIRPGSAGPSWNGNSRQESEAKVI